MSNLEKKPKKDTEPTKSTKSKKNNNYDITISETKQPQFQVEISQESTRSNIAQIFVVFFLAVISLALVTPFLLYFLDPNMIDDPVKASKEMTTVVASVLGGPFGFIVGFYFKNNEPA